MKLVFDAERLRNLNSGLGQFCRAMGDALLRNRPATADFTFIVPPAQRGVYGPGPRYVSTAWWQRYRSPVAADVWHATHQEVWIRPSPHARVVLTIMDLNFLERDDYSAAKKARRLAAVQRRVNRASSVVTISEFTASVVKAHLHVDVPIRVIYLASPVDMTILPTPAMPVNAALSALASRPFFLFVGGIHPKKNVDVLIPLLRDFPGHSLVLAGPDGLPYARKVRDYADEMGVADRLIMPGSVDEPTKHWLYLNCQALLFPSVSEGFGLPVVEAMSVGKPVFLSRLTSLPEIGGSEAYYWDSFDRAAMTAELRRGLADFASQPGKAAALRAAAARFSWDAAAREYWSLYDEVLRLPPR